jgi:hypothetical protein
MTERLKMGGHLNPRKARAGREMIALKRSNRASTVTPTNRKGRRRSQTRGYRRRAMRANGQQKRNRMSHKRNFIVLISSSYLFYAIGAEKVHGRERFG